MSKNGAPLYYACQLSPDNVGQVSAYLQLHEMMLGQTLMTRCEPGDYVVLSINAGNKALRSAQKCTQGQFWSKWIRKEGDTFADLFFPIKTPSLGISQGKSIYA